MKVDQIIQKYLERFPTEEERLEQLTKLSSESDELDIVSSYNMPGHITASGFVVSLCRTKVLQLQHRALQSLLQPGGHVQDGDKTPLDTAKRKIREEAGLSDIEHLPYHANNYVPIDIDIHPIPKNFNIEAHWHADFRYVFLLDGEVEIKLNWSKFSSYEWNPISSLMRKKTYEVLKPKIEQALSNEFRSKLFFDKIAEHTEVRGSCNAVIVGHVVPDAKVFFRALNERTPITAIIPKPKSVDGKVRSELEKQFLVLDVKRADVERNPDQIVGLIDRGKGPLILLDIGGYFAPVVHHLKREMADQLLGIVEDTENGLQRYNRVLPLPLPVVSVARSPLKENEDFLVGQSILYSADTVLREVGLNLEYMTCAVLGYGKIGSSIAHHLLSRGVKPWVYDTDPVRRISAKNRMCLIPSRAEIIQRADLLFCATGQKALQVRDFRNVKPGCVVCCVTSHDDELELPDEAEFSAENVSQHVIKRSNFNRYFYLLNNGNAVNFVHKPALGNFIHLVRAEMLYAVSLLSARSFGNGIQTLERSDQRQIAEIWLESFADTPQAYTDLSVVGIL